VSLFHDLFEVDCPAHPLSHGGAHRATVGYCVRTAVRTYDPFRVLSMLGGGQHRRETADVRK